jgi:hypothetical protein
LDERDIAFHKVDINKLRPISQIGDTDGVLSGWDPSEFELSLQIGDATHRGALEKDVRSDKRFGSGGIGDDALQCGLRKGGGRKKEDRDDTIFDKTKDGDLPFYSNFSITMTLALT